jgi:hypothetical protein
MSAPLMPSPLDYVGRRRFALYPPIKNAGPNEWLLGTGSWSEVQLVNAGTGLEVWVPRQYVCGVSGRKSGRLVVELTNELQFRAGALEPLVKRLIEMPVSSEAPPPRPSPARASGPACVVGIRLDDRTESTMSKAVVTLGVSALVVSILGALISVLAKL